MEQITDPNPNSKRKEIRIMGRFSGMKDAQVSAGGNYFTPGIYLVEVEKVHMITTRKGADMYIVETRVLESQSPNPPEMMKDGSPAAATKSPGSSPSYCVPMALDSALGNIKAFLAALLGENPEEITEEVAEESIADSNPLKGMKVRVECTMVVTNAGRDFTKHTWRSAE